MTGTMDRQQSIAEQAAAWLAALDSGSADRAAFEAWRAADPAHALAFLRVHRAWEMLGTAPAGIATEVATDVTTDSAADPSAAAPRDPTRRQLLKAAGLVAAAAAGGAALLPGRGTAATTAIGERKRLAIAPGIRLDLNTATSLRWRRDGDGFAIDLARGEVSLARAPHGPPCTIRAMALVARLGAGDFDVRLRDDGPGIVPEIVAIAGTARVSAPAWPDRAAPLAARHGLRIAGRQGALRRLSPGDLQALTAWRDGELLVAGEPLRVAIADYNRYLATPLVLADPAIGELRLGGRYRTADPTEFLHALAANFGITGVRRGDRILLGARS